MPTPILHESSTPSLTAPLVAQGGAVVMPLLHFVNGNPVADVPRARELWAGLKPGQPIAAYLPWAFERMAGVVQTQLNAAPSPDRYLRGCAKGILEAPEDLDAMTPLATALNKAGVIIKVLYIDLETEPTVWFPRGTTPEEIAAYERNWQVIVGALTSASIRATLPPVLKSIPPGEPAIYKALRDASWEGGDFGSAINYQRIAAIDTYFKSITLKSMHACHKAAGLRVARVIVQAHHNSRVPLVAPHGVPLAPCKLPPTFGSNLPLTGTATPANVLGFAHEPQRGAAYIAHSTAPWVHLSYTQTAEEVGTLLKLPAAGFVLFAPGPDDGLHLVDVIRAHTGG